MKFEIFKKHIDRIKLTQEREQELSKCIEKNLSTGTYCIVDICSDVTLSVVELLADYYKCHFEVQDYLDNDISWWLYEDVKKIIYTNKNGKEAEINVEDVKDFWKYLEDNKKHKEGAL